MSAHALPRLTPDEYLEIERAAETRSEFFDGQIYAMSGGTFRHAVIAANVVGELCQALRKTACYVCPSDLRVRVAPEGLYTYPDVSIVCEEPLFVDDRKDTILNPSIIFEVLSTSTEAHDRGFKFAQYRKLESLREYVLISQNEPLVEKFHKQSNGQWVLTEYAGLDAICRIDSVDCSVALRDIYEKISFDEPR